MIRRAVVQDADGLTALMRASSACRGHLAVMVESYTVASDHITDGDVGLMEDEAGVVGCYSLQFSPAPELDLLFTADRVQGRGVGASLLAHMRSRAAQCGAGHVTIVSHQPAAPFYAQMGAPQLGVRPASLSVISDRPIFRLSTKAA